MKQTELIPAEPAQEQVTTRVVVGGTAGSVLEQFVQLIPALAKDPAVDVAKMRALLEMAEHMQAKEAERLYWEALSKLQSRLPIIDKQGKASFPNKAGTGKVEYNFARYEDIMEAIGPMLADEGFSITFDQKPEGPATIYSAKMSHKAGHSETRTIRLPDDNSGSKNALQAIGSTLMYAQRYLFGMHVNLVKRGVDNDGHRMPDPGDDTPVTEDQFSVLVNLLAEHGGGPAYESKLLEWLKVKTLREVKKADYEKASRTIKNHIAERRAKGK